jgi:hypothetical protein
LNSGIKSTGARLLSATVSGTDAPAMISHQSRGRRRMTA